MSRYMSFLLMLCVSLFFVGCGERKDYTKLKTIVYKDSPRENVVVISVEDIPQTDLSRVVVGNEDCLDDAKFSLITSQSEKPEIGKRVEIVRVSYFVNSNCSLVDSFRALKK